LADKGERLESWKEIAAYLRRSPRTVQRWERLEGLPVHRLHHDKLGSVYAYPSELDAWWEDRRPRLDAAEDDEGPEGPEPPEATAEPSRTEAAEPSGVVAAPPSHAAPRPGRPGRRLLWVAAFGVLGLTVAWAAWRLRPAPQPRAQRLAVLPFANLTGDPEREFLSDGLTEELTAELGRLPQLGVIARTSVMRFKKTEKGVDAIGRELRVDWVLEGSVRQADRRLRVTAQLIRVADEVHVWAESYDRELLDLLAVQRQIARSVAEETRLRTSPTPAAHTAHPDAYLSYLQGRYHWNKRTEAGFKQGLDQFRQAIEKDPRFASAWTGLADSYMLMGNYGYLPVGEAAAQAREAASRALELEPGLADAHASLGLILASHDWDFPRAEQEFRRALELNPSHASARIWYGLLLVDLGRIPEARTQFLAGREADPLSENLSGLLAECDFLEGRYARALEEETATAEASPERPNAHIILGRIYLQMGRYEQALASLARARELTRDHPSVMGLYAYALARAGRAGEAREVLDRLVAEAAEKHVRPFDLALAATGLGDKDRALAWLEQVVEQRHVGARTMARDPEFNGLRDDPRFQALLKRVGIKGRPPPERPVG
jgi:TolB-like protein/Tfp pilus assembly protein PilF